MERETHRGQIRTGLFVLAALALLLIGSLMLAGASPLAGRRPVYTVLLSDAGGVQAGDPVRLAGVEVGRVDVVTLRDDLRWPVALEVRVEADLELRQGASARLSSDGLLGSPFLALERGPSGGARLAPGAVIEGRGGGGMAAALDDLGALARQTSDLVSEAGTLLETLSPRFERLLERGEAVLAHDNVDEVLQTLGVVRGAVERLEPRLARLGERLEAFADGAELTLASVPEAAAEAQALATDLRQALGPEGERLAAVLDAAQGALGSADAALGTVADQRADIAATVRDLRRAAANLQALSTSLKQRPDRLLRPSRQRDRKPGEDER